MPWAGGSSFPLLFNLVVDVLTRMLARATETGLIGGLLTQFRRGGGLQPFSMLVILCRSPPVTSFV
jgi:hypothetical protein